MKHRALLLLAALGIAGAAAAPARADYAVLRNGQRMHVTGYQRSGDRVELQVPGGRVVIPASELISVEAEDSFQPAPPATMGPFGEAIRDAAAKHGVDASLVRSVIAAESNFRPRAVSPKRAVGLMQLMPTTAARYGARDPFDPTQNINAGTQYLKDLLGQYNHNLALALAAYNAGPARVNHYRGVPPFPETRAYLQRIGANLAKQRQDRATAPRTMVCSSLRPRCEEAPSGTN